MITISFSLNLYNLLPQVSINYNAYPISFIIYFLNKKGLNPSPRYLSFKPSAYSRYQAISHSSSLYSLSKYQFVKKPITISRHLYPHPSLQVQEPLQLFQCKSFFSDFKETKKEASPKQYTQNECFHGRTVLCVGNNYNVIEIASLYLVYVSTSLMILWVQVFVYIQKDKFCQVQEQISSDL